MNSAGEGMLKWRKRSTEGEHEMVKSILAHFTHLPGADPGSRCHRKTDSKLFLPKVSHNEQACLSFQQSLDEHGQEHVASEIN